MPKQEQMPKTRKRPVRILPIFQEIARKGVDYLLRVKLTNFFFGSTTRTPLPKAVKRRSVTAATLNEFRRLAIKSRTDMFVLTSHPLRIHLATKEGDMYKLEKTGAGEYVPSYLYRRKARLPIEPGEKSQSIPKVYGRKKKPKKKK